MTMAGLLLAATSFVVEPQVYTNAFANPLTGFRRDFVTKKDGYAGYVPDNERRPYIRLYRHYIKWNDLENDAADGIEKIRSFCDLNWRGFPENNVKVIPRVYLDWLRAPGDEYWPADLETGDYTSEKFKARLKRLVARLGECWDEDPRVAWIQMGIVGAWGEHHSPAPDAAMQQLLGDAFTAAFRHKKVLVRYAAQFQNYRFGYIDDSWGWDCLMSYPPIRLMRDHIVNGRRFADQVIEGEFALGKAYLARGGYYPGCSVDEILGEGDRVQWVVDTIRDWHATTLGCISEYPATEPHLGNAARIQCAFGYDFRLSRVIWTPSVTAESPLKVGFEVVNEGSAPFYYPWPVVVSLLDDTRLEVAWEGEFKTDIRTWQPGEKWNKYLGKYEQPAKKSTVFGRFALPSELKPGRYVLALAVLDPAGRRPSLRFSVANYLTGGRHPFGYVYVNETAGDPALPADIGHDDLASDFTLGYEMPSETEIKQKGLVK